MTIKLKEQRLKRLMSQEELAEKSGISRITIGKIENGRQTFVKSSTMVALAHALGCPITDIFCPDC